MNDSSEPAGWQRVARLDPVRMADALYEHTGVRLTVEGPCPGGQVGTAYVRLPDGHRAVLKWRPGTRLADLRAGPVAVTDVLRAAGYPAPATELSAQVGPDVVLVQELLPGAPPGRLGHAALDRALALNDLQAGRLAGHPEVPETELYLTGDGPGFCLHGPLREFSRRSAALEAWIAEVGASAPGRLPGVDAVHHDFHPGNLLAGPGGTVTGVVDWDGAGRGDRRFDLVTLRFGLYPDAAEPGVAERLDEILAGFPEEVLRPAWACMSLRMTDWAIRHFTAAAAEAWIGFAERGAARLG
ncbi:aminoglycoside phosphotransferase family protein [Streptomyces johnsoniae]|uniref:Aminoglycoside phosphotransferase family protein n=1 Tax=Streptomyces johnsoniae TaxID=3075532 RepID=A0ABU2SC09_9ACTN|nr:aminoglycoside phosphotransferase family protein [Streptomyces sp. DSM 41886]MDT0445230.1 aminoglycoside phosphotransferase family protein [Streptomyces sp. DSM 41886]